MFRTVVTACAVLVAVPATALACEQHQKAESTTRSQALVAQAQPQNPLKSKQAKEAKGRSESAPGQLGTAPGLAGTQPAQNEMRGAATQVQAAAVDAGTQLRTGAEATMSSATNTATGAAAAAADAGVQAIPTKKKPSAKSLAQPKAAPGTP